MHEKRKSAHITWLVISCRFCCCLFNWVRTQAEYSIRWQEMKSKTIFSRLRLRLIAYLYYIHISVDVLWLVDRWVVCPRNSRHFCNELQHRKSKLWTKPGSFYEFIGIFLSAQKHWMDSASFAWPKKFIFNNIIFHPSVALRNAAKNKSCGAGLWDVINHAK